MNSLSSEENSLQRQQVAIRILHNVFTIGLLEDDAFDLIAIARDHHINQTALTDSEKTW